jgi:D-glycero-beta-D-manno-heptose 1-phosphate adenylyltransferase
MTGLTAEATAGAARLHKRAAEKIGRIFMTGGNKRNRDKRIYNRSVDCEACDAVNLDNPKLIASGEIVRALGNLRAARKRVVLTNGVFDLLHTGHLYFLQRTRMQGDALVVALNSDVSVRALKGPARPVQTEEQRAYALGALACVDAVFVFNTPRLDAEIRAIRPDIYCKAGDYTLDKLDAGERAALEEVGAEIKFLPFLPGFSTTNLIARIRAAGEI